MNDEQRLERIEQLLDQINPISYEKIFLEVKMYSEEDEKVKEDLAAKIDDLINQRTPLFTELRQLQCAYMIEFQGKLNNLENTYWNDPETGIFHLKTCCDINTSVSPSYQDEACVKTLIVEVHETLSKLRYTELKILNIRRV